MSENIEDFLEEYDVQSDDSSDEMFEHFNLTVDKGQVPIRVDKFLLDRLHQISRNKIQNAIRAGNVKINQNLVKPNYKVKPTDNILIVLPHPPRDNDDLKGEPIDLNVLYEDDDVMVINKPPGLVVHPGMGNPNGTLVNGLVHYFNEHLPIKEGNSADRPGLVHRIDKDTSGLLVIAKNEFAMTHLARQFFEHSVSREYIALVWGNIEPPNGRIEGHLGRNPTNRMQMMVFEDGSLGKFAATNYVTVEDLYYVSIVKCVLETGRTHQIRAHMKHMGHPLFNDSRYGGDKIIKGTVFTKYKQFVQNCFDICPRQALHARTLAFDHPTKGKRMSFECPIPDDMETLIEKWRHYIEFRKPEVDS